MFHKKTRWLMVVAAVLLLVDLSGTARAEPWLTEGRNPFRQKQVSEPVGWLESDPQQWLRPLTGQSATQPIMLDDRIFHQIGEGLWQFRFDWSKFRPDDPSTWTMSRKLIARSNKSPVDGATMRISSSTPTFSPESKMLYWGTAHGQVWAYNTESQFAPSAYDLTPGCSVVSSPLVLRVDDDARNIHRDLVVVGQKPTEYCSEPGKVFVIWGLDGVGEQGYTSFNMDGWATPSPLPDLVPNRFIMGTDLTPLHATDVCSGFNGRILKFEVSSPDNQPPYTITKIPWGNSCAPWGVTSSFVDAYGFAYWVDDHGWLWGRKLADGSKPPGWPDQHIPLAPMVEGQATATAFTNTAPAVYALDDAAGVHGTIYVTLRNYWPVDDFAALRGCLSECSETGAPGAIVAVDLETGQRRWAERMPLGTGKTRYASLNTNPLLVLSQQAVIFGDVNGRIYSRKMQPDDSNATAGLMAGPNESFPDFSILNFGQPPARGRYSWQQVSGAGTEPVITSGTMPENAGFTWFMVGANWQGSDPNNSWMDGALVMIPAGTTYNLKWVNSAKSPPDPWTDGTQVTVSGTITLADTPLALGQVRKNPAVKVTWFLVPKNWDYSPDKIIRLGASEPATLSPTMTAGQTIPVRLATSFAVGTQVPDEGEIIGVIDAVHLAVDTTRHEGRLARLLLGSEFDPTAAQDPKNSVEPADKLADNFVHIPFRKQVAVDLAAQITSAPASVDCDASGRMYDVSWVIRNQSPQSLTGVPYTVRLQSGQNPSWQALRKGTVTLDAGGSSSLVTRVPLAHCDDRYTVQVEVNPGPDPRTIANELPPFDNNVDSRSTLVSPGDTQGMPELQGGAGDVIIVDPTCQASSSADAHPCDNLNLTIPGRR